MTHMQVTMPAGSMEKESKFFFLTAKQYDIAEFFIRHRYIYAECNKLSEKFLVAYAVQKISLLLIIV